MSRIKDFPAYIHAAWTLQDTYDRFLLPTVFNRLSSLIIRRLWLKRILPREKLLMVEVCFSSWSEDELIRILELTVQMAEIHNDMEQGNNYSLGFKADRKILVKLYLEKVEKQVEELVSSELVN